MRFVEGAGLSADVLAVLTRELFDGTTTYDRATDRLRATKGPR